MLIPSANQAAGFRAVEASEQWSVAELGQALRVSEINEL